MALGEKAGAMEQTDRQTWSSTQLESTQEHPAGQPRDTHLASVTPVPPNPHMEPQ